uniref:Uncharacterized protein n=2 Tax=Pseudo-nitzschia australis TaxID=44445 RepID=A0A7S4AR26_9STRA
MPTFRSIPIPPSVRSRLLQPQQKRANHDNSGQHPNKTHQQPQLPNKSSVATPRSLLTRDPNDLIDLFSGGHGRNEQKMAGILTLRSHVARAMISKTRNGKRLLCYNREDPQKRNRWERNQDQDLMDQFPLIPGGSMSLLHAWDLQQEMNSKNQKRFEIFSTGCRALDNLLAFPAEYFFSSDDGVAGSAISHNVDTDFGEVKGIPRGYVLRLSGTTGKTQLALQFVAKAITQSSQRSPGWNKRIRYCHSTAGHSGCSLAQRLFQLIENINIGNDDHRVREDTTKKIEFQPIATVSQLISTIAKLEEEWLQRTASEQQQPQGKQQLRGGSTEKGPVAMLVLDALPWMLVEREEAERIQALNRWLKRIARHYHVWIIIVTPTVGGRPSSKLSSLYGNTMSPDIHLRLQKQTSTRSSLQLMRHPAKAVTEQDCITLLHNSKFGITTPE